MEEVGSWSFPRAAPLELGLFRRFHATCAVDQTIYVFGGETKITSARNGPPVKRLLNDLLAFTPEESNWTLLDDGTEEAPSRRKGVQLVACRRNNSLYLFGGAGPGIYYNDLWRYDLLEQRWHNESTKCLETSLTNDVAYPAPRAYHITAIYDDCKLIVYGGYGVEAEEDALWEYDIDGALWRSLSTPGVNAPGMRFGLCACVYSGGLYICTGQQNNRLVPQTLWRLDLATGKYIWQQLATSGASPTQRTYAASYLVELRPPLSGQSCGRWLLHGGSSADTVFNDAYELDLDTLHWHPSVNLCTAPTIEGHTMTAVKTTWGSTSIFILGGATSGPVIPRGPIARCDLFLDKWQLSPQTAHLRLEDFCIRLPAVADHIWELQRTQLELEDKVNVLCADKSELEESNQRLGQLLRYYQQSCTDRTTTNAIRTALENTLLTLSAIELQTNENSPENPKTAARIPEHVEEHMLLSYIAELARDVTIKANAAHEYTLRLRQGRGVKGRQAYEDVSPGDSRNRNPSVSGWSPRLLSVATEADCKKSLILSPQQHRKPCAAVTRAVACGAGGLKLHSRESEQPH